MFACTELTTGYDDFGKVIFLQSHCREPRIEGVVTLPQEGCAHCQAIAASGGVAPSAPACTKARLGVEKLIALYADRPDCTATPPAAI